jgi:hypothetical protein
MGTDVYTVCLRGLDSGGLVLSMSYMGAFLAARQSYRHRSELERGYFVTNRHFDRDRLNTDGLG